MASDAHRERIAIRLADLAGDVGRLKFIAQYRQEEADAAHNDVQRALDLLERAQDAAYPVLGSRQIPVPRRAVTRA